MPPARAQGFLAVARVLAPHGIRGELRCEQITHFPERFRHTERLYAGGDHRPLVLERARITGRRILMKLAGVENREQADALVGQILYVPESEAVLLPPGSYFWHQILGMRVLSTEGAELGHVVDILQTGSNDVYVVHGDGREILIPALQEVVRAVDLEQGCMTVQLIAGL